METVTDFIFLDSKITADGDSSHEIKRHLLLGWKAMTNLDSILKKQRHYFDDKGPYSQSYSFSWCKELTHWKRPWCWARLKAGGEGDNRGQNGLMESPTPWTWVWASSRSWWWTGRPGVLQPMGSRRVGHNWATELINIQIERLEQIPKGVIFPLIHSKYIYLLRLLLQNITHWVTWITKLNFVTVLHVRTLRSKC